MPTSQKVQIDTYDFGASLTNPTLGALTTGTTISNGTANSCNEQTADSGVYIADFVGADASALIPAGTYRLRTTVNGKPLKRFVTFTGVDGELAYARSERAAELDPAVQTQIDAIETDAAASVGYLTTLVSRLTANAATAIQNLWYMITGTGASSKYTVAALENAPSAGGGDAEQDTLLEVQTTIDALALSLAGASVTVTSRVSGSEITAYIGDDYKVRSGTELEITVSDTGGALHTKLTAIGTSNLYFGASLPRKDPGQITGTISSLSYASNVLTIAVEITACASGLTTGDYTYQIQSSQAQGGDFDDFVELEGTLVVKQRTVAVRG